jgi:uncharacterized protein YyaL (SSP411 family)
MSNALANETSPYLRQHAENPVDWLPWGQEALTRARETNRPLLVSIGYSSCHWCHVMERESFEDPTVASVMNAHFVCVKVDREERPDVDAIAMDYCQATTGHGGWPLNVFMTPEQIPFHAGTYYPPEERNGMPSWRQVLEAIAAAWAENADQLRGNRELLIERLSGGARLRPSEAEFSRDALAGVIDGLRENYDSIHGGWGMAPKFPASSTIELLLRLDETQMTVHTLKSMAGGGMCDQVGGGFHRYSVDATWTIPHFEKMLYDNALLARAYLHAWQLTGDDELLATCRATLDWALREMQAPEGGFYSALDADSEGSEGKFYVWSMQELEEVLGDDAEAAINWFGVTGGGNFMDPHVIPKPSDPALNVLEDRGPRPDDAARDRIRARLLEVRDKRVWPGLDDKRLASWNGLMINALADAGAVLGDERYLTAARKAAEFVLDEMRDEDGRLLRTYNEGRAKLAGYLEDHAFMLEALITLHEATFEPRWFAAAREMGDALLAHFHDPVGGGFFSTADDHEALLTRRKDLEDAPIPSGASSAAFGLLRLAALTGEHSYAAAAESQLRLLYEIAPQYPGAFAHQLQALDFHLRQVREVAIVGPPQERAALTAVVRERPLYDVVLSGGDGDSDGSVVPLLEARTMVDGRAAAYVCEGFACRAPITDAGELRQALRP